MKAADLLGWLVIVEYREVALAQILHVAAMLVGDGEHHIDFVYRLGNSRGRLIGRVRSPARLGLRGCGRLKRFTLGRRIGGRGRLRLGGWGGRCGWRRRWLRVALLLPDRPRRGGGGGVLAPTSGKKR